MLINSPVGPIIGTDLTGADIPLPAPLTEPDPNQGVGNMAETTVAVALSNRSDDPLKLSEGIPPSKKLFN